MDKAIADYLGGQQDVKSLAKESLKGLKSYSRAFRFIQVVRHKTKQGSYSIFKRAFDIVVGLVGTICLLPIMLVVKIANLFHGDRESIIFKQKRIGKNGKEINIYKIRSMVPNAEKILEELMEKDPKIKEEYQLNKKLKHDPRITKVGAFIRKTSLDEFAQFVNILKGDMTVVGPRPYLLREKEDMGEYFSDIVKTKPGLTGYWQVMGRSNTTFEKRLELEKYYSNHSGFKLDIKIFFKTFKALLSGKGAD